GHQVERVHLERESTLPGPRDLEEIVDQSRHAIDLAFDAAQVGVERIEVEGLSLLSMPAETKAEQLRQGLQGSERCLQLVRDDREELVLLARRLVLFGEIVHRDD